MKRVLLLIGFWLIVQRVAGNEWHRSCCKSLIANCLSNNLIFQHNNVFISLRRLYSGEAFDWAQFKLPKIRSKYGWLLAGGINPENVSEALSSLKPQGVDVSSGICASDGIQKDQSRIASFMDAVHSVQYWVALNYFESQDRWFCNFKIYPFCYLSPLYLHFVIWVIYGYILYFTNLNKKFDDDLVVIWLPAGHWCKKNRTYFSLVLFLFPSVFDGEIARFTVNHYCFDKSYTVNAYLESRWV